MLDAVRTSPHRAPGQGCAHCGLPVPADRQSSAARDFCCEGCRLVHAILEQRSLGRYYTLRRQGAWLRPASPAPSPSTDFGYLDDPEFRALYSRAGDGGPRMDFFLEGIHCAACIWLLEQVPSYAAGTRAVQIDMGRSVATVTLQEKGSFAAVAMEFSRLGYRPHPVRAGEAEARQLAENRFALIRVGVAGGCAMNLMLFAFSLYSGASGSYAAHFRWLSLVIFLPVLLFSAVPFYRAAWSALRTRSISIDVPIVLGIAIGFSASVANLLSGSPHIYFDSLGALVFLLSGSRYVLRRAQQSALAASSLARFLTPSTVRRRRAGEAEFEETALDLVRRGDVVEVRVGEPIPVDGVIVAGTSNLNCALLTGESEPVAATVGAPVFAGTVNDQAPIEVEVRASGPATRLGGILKEVEESLVRKAPIAALADRISRAFVLGVIALASVAFVLAFRHGGLASAVNAALAMVIVTCPCALALATPLAMTSAIRRAAGRGILIKGADALERLADAKRIYLDKTGTLTEGTFEVLGWTCPSELVGDVTRAVQALESSSLHPVARALVRYFPRRVGDAALPVPAAFRETLGRGVEGVLDGVRYEIRAHSDPGAAGSQVAVHRDGQLVAKFTLGERLREEARPLLVRLRSLGFRPQLLSGDSPAAVHKISRALEFTDAETIAGATPEAKHSIVAGGASDVSIMVGDGANDAAALAAAGVGIAIRGGMEVSLRAADVYLQNGGLERVADLVELARETRRVLYRNFAFSFAYNLLGIAAVFAGTVGPLFAAVLMPLSALTVYTSSVAGTRRARTLTAEGRA